MSSLTDPYRIDHGDKFRLQDYVPDDTGGLKSKDRAERLLNEGTERLRDLQSKLYANDQWALLVILQAMDAAGKDSLIEHVMSGVNPQGCQVYAFKAPSTEELNHDYLWRTAKRLPERGRIGIFNRSYYEEVLVVRVHPELLEKQHIPSSLVTKHIWRERFEDMNNFERYLTRNGIAIRKFFLNVSREEQKKRFLKRLEEPDKNWKFSIDDIAERERWDDYMHAYEDMIRHTSTPHAPWYVLPADNKWYTRLIAAEAIVEALEDLKLSYPKVDKEKRKELRKVEAILRKEAPALKKKQLQ
jgi:PPK2 family polyphosphate:nucleotide phosphotransferase